MLTSTSAGEFIDRTTTLDMLAGRNVEVLGAAAQADEAATTAQAAAEQTAADAQAQLETVTAQQAALQSQITTYQAEYQRLSAEEQAAAQAAAAAARAAEAAAASAAASSAPAPNASSSSSASSPRTGGSSASSAPAAAAPAGSAVTANSGAAQTAVDTAMAQLGDPYVWAAAGPDSFDCSGLMQYAYAAAGISLPHSSGMQARMGRAVTRAELQPGDLIAFYSPVSHIGMYIGNGMMVNAPSSGDVVKTVNIDYMGQITAMRRLAG